MTSCALDGDSDFQVRVSEELLTSSNSSKCLECKKEILALTPFYMVTTSHYDDDVDDDVDVSDDPCCEVCGDLALSVLELGYCWEFGNLRHDIAEINGQW